MIARIKPVSCVRVPEHRLTGASGNLNYNFMLLNVTQIKRWLTLWTQLRGVGRGVWVESF